MVNRNLIRNLEDDSISQELESLFTSEEDLASLKDLINVIDAEPVLVMSAEGHPED